MVKTAVLMATYNGQSFIKNQLDSIKNQTLKPDYVLIRDDGSVDGTVSFVNGYIKENKLKNWKIIKNPVNLGWRLNFRQLLIDILEYDVDYIFFSDQDDSWYLDKNQKQVQILTQQPDAELLSGDVDIKLIAEHASVPNLEKLSDTDHYTKYNYSEEYHTIRPGWTLAFSRQLAQEIATNWPQDANVSHDNIFTMVSSILGLGYNLNESVGVHIRHGENASGNKKTVFSIKSSKEDHIKGLKVFADAYCIIYKVSLLRNYPKSNHLKKLSSFYTKRYQKAKQNKLGANLLFIITHLKQYPNMNGIIRDLIFSFKK